MGRSASKPAKVVGKTSLHLRIDFGGERSIGPGKVRLLERINETGSISAAGRGGAAVTEIGNDIVRLYRELERRTDGVSTPKVRSLARRLTPARSARIH